MQIYLIRHGQTDWNIRGKLQGSMDIELNQTGITQAKLLSNTLLNSDYNFSAIYSSPQKRAIQTAQILSELTKVKYVSIEGLQEINFGEWEGLTWNEIEERYPAQYKKWSVNQRYSKPPKGESYQELLNRVLPAIHKVIKRNRENVVIVTHRAVIMCLQCYLTNTPFDQMMKFNMDNSSILKLDSKLFISENVQ
ncbi:alpha-ribazole phosphatase [Virgibacillus sp. MSJ-26]|uniref:alpha-ribazole phosphatase n=1 Tax=Virgibacillus sp. MSJ-26 TaxID=2841522 RepID=UPI001C11C5EA|nr:alpha-ribazole phosphatase [Virgibacillus sp. MSJ-26]MBU5465881.1 alpha-ribazole phosphatase [Virgibacillus sp. MSJ-26]